MRWGLSNRPSVVTLSASSPARSWQLTARFELKSIKFDLKAKVLDFDVSGFAFGGVPCLQANPSIGALIIELVDKTGLIELFDNAGIYEGVGIGALGLGVVPGKNAKTVLTPWGSLHLQLFAADCLEEWNAIKP